MADKLTPERRSWNMSRIRGKHTKPELLVRRLLHAKGYRYRLHGQAGGTRLPGNPPAGRCSPSGNASSRTPHHGRNARTQLARTERLGEVVVGA
jgi:hypothetical protein